jgi:CBS domain-containing protein
MPDVAETMSRNLVGVSADTTLCDAAKLMSERHIGAVLVLDGSRLDGILSERDVLRAVAAQRVEGSLVREWMTAQPETIEPSDSTTHAAILMTHGGFRHLPVVDGGTVVGMLSIRDIVRVVIQDEVPRGV